MATSSEATTGSAANRFEEDAAELAMVARKQMIEIKAKTTSNTQRERDKIKINKIKEKKKRIAARLYAIA